MPSADAAGCGALPDALDQAGGRAMSAGSTRPPSRAWLQRRWPALRNASPCECSPGCSTSSPSATNASSWTRWSSATASRRTGIVGDTIWPLRDAPAWPHDPGRPHLGIYRLLLENLCREIRPTGTMCFHGETSAITSTLAPSDGSSSCCAEGSPWLGVGSLLLLSHAERGVRGLRSGTRSPPPASRLLQPFRGQRRPAGCPPNAKSWLTAEALDAISRGRVMRPGWPWRGWTALPLNRNPVGRGKSAPLGTAQANRLGIEVRNPYATAARRVHGRRWPPPPGHRGGLYKHVLRAAMRGVLPDRVRLRKEGHFVRPALQPRRLRARARHGPLRSSMRRTLVAALRPAASG